MSGVKNNSFDNAMNAYKTQNYSEAIGLLQSIHNTKPQNDTINYFLGMVFYLENNTKAATPFFENGGLNTQIKHTNEALQSREGASILHKPQYVKKLFYILRYFLIAIMALTVPSKIPEKIRLPKIIREFLR